MVAKLNVNVDVNELYFNFYPSMLVLTSAPLTFTVYIMLSLSGSTQVPVNVLIFWLPSPTNAIYGVDTIVGAEFDASGSLKV